MGRYSKAFSIKKQFQSPNCQTCQGQSRTLKKIVFLELFLRIIEDEKWNLFEKLGQLRTPTDCISKKKRAIIMCQCGFVTANKIFRLCVKYLRVFLQLESVSVCQFIFKSSALCSDWTIQLCIWCGSYFDNTAVTCIHHIIKVPSLLHSILTSNFISCSVVTLSKSDFDDTSEKAFWSHK